MLSLRIYSIKSLQICKWLVIVFSIICGCCSIIPNTNKLYKTTIFSVLNFTDIVGYLMTFSYFCLLVLNIIGFILILNVQNIIRLNPLIIVEYLFLSLSLLFLLFQILFNYKSVSSYLLVFFVFFIFVYHYIIQRHPSQLSFLFGFHVTLRMVVSVNLVFIRLMKVIVNSNELKNVFNWILVFLSLAIIASFFKDFHQIEMHKRVFQSDEESVTSIEL
ncbi:six tm domain protein [Entamoeba histolytica]|uniref:Six tm domain protein n=1 Tax=Entamoeba histolytica TaxID=5759 RepID=A0A175JTX4_ENTHI|nr:six tm domain protein [Entamoeba histolytica]